MLCNAEMQCNKHSRNEEMEEEGEGERQVWQRLMMTSTNETAATTHKTATESATTASTRCQQQRGYCYHQGQCKDLWGGRSAAAHSHEPFEFRKYCRVGQPLPWSRFPGIVLAFLPKDPVAHIGKSTRCGRMQPWSTAA